MDTGNIKLPKVGIWETARNYTNLYVQIQGLISQEQQRLNIITSGDRAYTHVHMYIYTFIHGHACLCSTMVIREHHMEMKIKDRTCRLVSFQKLIFEVKTQIKKYTNE